MSKVEQLVPEEDRPVLMWSDLAMLVADLNSKTEFKYEPIYFVDIGKEILDSQTQEYLFPLVKDLLRSKATQFLMMVPGLDAKASVSKLAYLVHNMVALMNTRKQKATKRSVKDFLPTVAEVLMQSAAKKQKLAAATEMDPDDCTSLTSSQEECYQAKVLTPVTRQFFLQNPMEVSEQS
jgi:hypothetical protein